MRTAADKPTPLVSYHAPHAATSRQAPDDPTPLVSTVASSSPRPRILHHVIGSRPVWQAWAQGHANHMTLFPLRRAYATAREPSDAPHESPPPDRRPPWETLELGYKSQHPRALTLSPFTAAAGGTAAHSVKPREKVEGEARWRRKPLRGGARWSQERHPDQLQRRSCSTRHCIAPSRPRLTTALPSYHHKPYGEPHRSPLTTLTVLAMEPHPGERRGGALPLLDTLHTLHTGTSPRPGLTNP